MQHAAGTGIDDAGVACVRARQRTGVAHATAPVRPAVLRTSGDGLPLLSRAGCMIPQLRDGGRTSAEELAQVGVRHGAGEAVEALFNEAVHRLRETGPRAQRERAPDADPAHA